MSVKPILFNTDMVCAILEGRKTVTRRAVKPQPRYPLEQMPVGPHKGEWHEYNEGLLNITSPWGYQYTPPYRPGDILYVRETWAKVSSAPTVYAYKANGDYSVPRWYPSIHMPHEAARIFLRVTDVRVERLRDITLEDGYKEGLDIPTHFDALWNSTIKKADLALYGWDANPWVWVIEFERISREEAMHHAI